MSSGPKHNPIQTLTVAVARSLLAAIVALSFFTTVVSIGTAASPVGPGMACCIGKPGHESGSCRSGILEPVSKLQPEPEVLCGQEPAPTATRSSKAVSVKPQAEEGGHCNLHASPAGDIISDSTRQSEPEATSDKSAEPGFTVIHALSTPCSAECGTCSVSYTRRPRPREQSTLSSPARPRLHLTASILLSDFPQVKILDTKCVQLRPRAPPARLV